MSLEYMMRCQMMSGQEIKRINEFFLIHAKKSK